MPCSKRLGVLPLRGRKEAHKHCQPVLDVATRIYPVIGEKNKVNEQMSSTEPPVTKTAAVFYNYIFGK